MRELAEAARLAQVAVQARPPVETGTRGEVVLELVALGGYEEVDRFFQKLSLSHRLIDVESLTLTATTEDVDPARAPCCASRTGRRARPAGRRPSRSAALPPACRGRRSTRSAATRRWRSRSRRRSPRAAARGARRGCSSPSWPPSARERPVVLGYASLGEEFTIRGLALGEGPLRAFESRLERGFFRALATS